MEAPPFEPALLSSAEMTGLQLEGLIAFMEVPDARVRGGKRGQPCRGESDPSRRFVGVTAGAPPLAVPDRLFAGDGRPRRLMANQPTSVGCHPDFTRCPPRHKP